MGERRVRAGQKTIALWMGNVAMCSRFHHDLPNIWTDIWIGSPETTRVPMLDHRDSKDASRGMSTIDLHAESPRDERSLTPAGAVGRSVDPKSHPQGIRHSR
jgi:hypothetical protein